MNNTNNESEKFTWKARLRSFSYAWAGIIQFFKTGHNARIHLVMAILAIAACIFFKISDLETIAVVFAIAFVWISEMINTAIEKTMDFITDERLPQVKVIKDIAAGAVLIASVTALIIGIIVFAPKLF
ncbi:MAG TPA: diacylglycerol kinase family protein [Flavisolibacter sp.]|nr:diacylglycerol kinase family protein [Flavisolibacter sp.]